MFRGHGSFLNQMLTQLLILGALFFFYSFFPLSSLLPPSFFSFFFFPYFFPFFSLFSIFLHFFPSTLGGPGPPGPPRGPGPSTLWRVSTPVSGPGDIAQRSYIHRQTNTDTQTHRHTQTQTDTHTHTHKDTHTHRYTQISKPSHHGCL